jgi:hypothetical protein
MKFTIVTLSSCLAVVFLNAAPFRAAEVVFNRSDATTDWSIDLGWEFPGAEGKFSTADDPSVGKCVRLDYDFSRGGRYVGASCARNFHDTQSLRLSLYPGENGSQALVRVVDATGQTLMTYVPASPGKWQTIGVPLVSNFFGTHWGGANDGTLHLPIRSFFVGVQKGKTPSGVLRIGRLTGVVHRPADTQGWRLAIVPGAPDGIAFPGEPVECQVRVENCLNEPRQGHLDLIQLLDDGQQIVNGWDVKAPAQATECRQMVVATAQPGYRCLRARLTVGDHRVAEVESGLAVVSRPADYGKPAPESYFGFCLAENLESVDRLGAKTVLTAITWQYVETVRGSYNWGALDQCVAEAQRHGIQVIVKLQPRPPEWAAWRVAQRPVLAGYPAPEQTAAWQAFVHAVADRYREKIVGIEIENEPDLSEWLDPKLSLEEGAAIYARLLTAGWKGAKAADPNCLVVGLGVSEADFFGNFKFCRTVLGQSGKHPDVFTGHPYASQRYFGPGKKPILPEENGLPKLCRSAMDMLVEAGLPRRMWIGELGWALDTTCPVLSDESLQFAGCVAQALILGRTVPGVTRFLYFTQVGMNENGYEYGVLRGTPPYPLPAACAYATCARMLAHARPIGPIDLGPRVAAWRFRNDGRDGVLVVIWSRNGTFSLHVKLPVGGQAWNSFGRTIGRDESVDAALGPMPLYFTAPASLATRLESAVGQAVVAEKAGP